MLGYTLSVTRGVLVLFLLLPIGLVLPGALLALVGKVLVSVGEGMEAAGYWWIGGVDWVTATAWSSVGGW
jgi:hypothetical protein